MLPALKYYIKNIQFMPVERFSIHAQKQFVSCLDSLDMLKYAAIFIVTYEKTVDLLLC